MRITGNKALLIIGLMILGLVLWVAIRFVPEPAAPVPEDGGPLVITAERTVSTTSTGETVTEYKVSTPPGLRLEVRDTVRDMVERFLRDHPNLPDEFRLVLPERLRDAPPGEIMGVVRDELTQFDREGN